MSYGVLARWQLWCAEGIKPSATRPSYHRSFYFEEGAGAGARETAAAAGRPGPDLGSSMSATGGVERSGVLTAKFRR
jgi:hypothetical protein